MAEEVIGSGFKQSVKDQLKAREDLINSKVKSDKHLLFFNANSAWARLSSSVNTLSVEEVQKITTEKDPIGIEGSNQLANSNILKNGLTKNKEGLKGGIDQTKGFNPTSLGQGSSSPGAINYFPLEQGDQKTATYHNYASLGFRPEPGIQSVSVKSKNTFGTLREAEISATVWTLEDLELIQALYLRPGYSVLLEWGHTLWIDTKNDNEVSTTIYNFNRFTEGKVKQSKIYDTLTRYRNDSSNNYDAMYGYVSNFTWNFRQDGGYDVSIKVISRGSILESLAATFEPSGRLPGTKFRYDQSEDTKEDGYIERISVYHKFAQEISEIRSKDSIKKIEDRQSVYSPNSFVSGFAYNLSMLDEQFARDFIDKLIPFEAYDYKQHLDGSGTFVDDSITSIIVPLRTVLDIFNKFITAIDRTENNEENKILRFYTGETDIDPLKGPYDKQSKFITTPHHFSCDPMICVLPQPPTKLTIEQKEYYPGYVERRWGKFENKGIGHPAINASIKTGKGETDDILNIYVGLYPFLQKVQKAYEGEKPEKGFLVILQEFLDQISDVLGGVNEFDIHYDEDENIHYVVDRKLTPVQIQQTSLINLTGLKSTITNLNVSSKISSEIASTVSIAAQGGSGNYKDSVEAMLKWNRGLIDRHTPDKSVTSNLSTGSQTLDNFANTSAQQSVQSRRGTQKAKRLKEFLQNVEDVFRDFRSNDYDTSKFSELKAYHQEFCNEYVIQKYYGKFQGDLKPVPGLIPVELSFDTIGIAGLKIGQAFRVSEGILPKKYTDDFGFLITGLDHKVENNKWITSIKTQFFSINK